jgi:hypothetical protein
MRWTRRFPRGLLRARMVAGYGSTLPQQEASPLAQRRNGRGLASATRVGHRVGLETTGPGVLRQRLTRRAVLHAAGRPPPMAYRAPRATRPAPRGGRLRPDDRPAGLGAPRAPPRVARPEAARGRRGAAVRNDAARRGAGDRGTDDTTAPPGFSTPGKVTRPARPRRAGGGEARMAAGPAGQRWPAHHRPARCRPLPAVVWQGTRPLTPAAGPSMSTC